MTSNTERLAVILEASKGAVNECTAGIIRSCLALFMSYERAKRFVRRLIDHGVMSPTSRGYSLIQRRYKFLPSNPAVQWTCEWMGFGLFFDEGFEGLYDFDYLRWKVNVALKNDELEPTWKSYVHWRSSNSDRRCHSSPWLMQEFTTQAHFFSGWGKPKLYCFGVLRLMVRYAVAVQGLTPTWRTYELWRKGKPQAHSTPRLMKGYTNQDDFFGVACRKRKRDT